MQISVIARTPGLIGRRFISKKEEIKNRIIRIHCPLVLEERMPSISEMNVI